MCRTFDLTDDPNAASRSPHHLHPLHLTIPPKFSMTSASSPQTYARPPPSATPTPDIVTTPSSPVPLTTAPSPPSKPPVIHFKALFCGLAVGASLLPSLKAQYKVCRICFIFSIVFRGLLYISAYTSKNFGQFFAPQTWGLTCWSQSLLSAVDMVVYIS